MAEVSAGDMAVSAAFRQAWPMDAERTIRRLAAILVADVVGYSRLMAEDETAALAALNRHREVEFDPVVAQHNGRIVKLMGDGTLVEFRSVVDAVACAVAIQSATHASGYGPAITLRIGINLGDIIIQGDDIYGDGVNIAAPLEPLATPGGVCISSVVNESLRDRADIDQVMAGLAKAGLPAGPSGRSSCRDDQSRPIAGIN